MINTDRILIDEAYANMRLYVPGEKKNRFHIDITINDITEAAYGAYECLTGKFDFLGKTAEELSPSEHFVVKYAHVFFPDMLPYNPDASSTTPPNTSI